MSTETDLAPPDLAEANPFDFQPDPVAPAIGTLLAKEIAAFDAGPARAVAGTGDGSFDRPVFGITEYKPETNAHPFDGKCKVCDAPLPPDSLWRDMDLRSSDGRWLHRGWLPINCCESCYAVANSPDTETAQARREHWLTRCPIEFRDDWDSRKGNDALLRKVLSFNPALGRGLVIHGQTDSGKTRATWRLMRRLSDEGIDWHFVESLDLLDNIPPEAYKVRVLVIDDLGNDSLAGPREVRLLKLLRHRCNWHMPIIVTTQFVGDSLVKRFSETATAQAVIRRLREFCDSIHAKPANA